MIQIKLKSLKARLQWKFFIFRSKSAKAKEKAKKAYEKGKRDIRKQKEDIERLSGFIEGPMDIQFLQKSKKEEGEDEINQLPYCISPID